MSDVVVIAEMQKLLRTTRRVQRRLLRKASRLDASYAMTREWLLRDVSVLEHKAREIEERLSAVDAD